MSTGYKIVDTGNLYFLTFQVVNWIDIFSRKVYRDIFIESLGYCIKYKGLTVYAYVVMTNHVHLIVKSSQGNLSEIIRDLKRHTSKQILKEIEESVIESRKEWGKNTLITLHIKQNKNIKFMKKIYLIIVLSILPLCLFSQIEDHHVIFHLNGGYVKTTTGNGAASLGAVSTNGYTGNISLLAGIPIGNWEFGIGLEYQKENKDTDSRIYYRLDNLNYTQTYALYAVQLTNFSWSGLVGKLYATRHVRLLDKFYFSPNIAFNWGEINGMQEAYTISREMATPGSSLAQPRSGYASIKNDVTSEFSSLRIAPAFTYFFSRHFALNLETGGAEVALADWEWSSRQAIVQFNPAYWQLGVTVGF